MNLLVVAPGIMPSVLQAALIPLSSYSRNEIQWRYENIKSVRNTDLIWADTILIIRGFDKRFTDLAIKAKMFGCHLIFDIDDNIALLPAFSRLNRHFQYPVVSRQVSFMARISDITRVYSLEMVRELKDVAGNKIRKCSTWQYSTDLPEIENSFHKSEIGELRVLYPSSNELDEATTTLISKSLLNLNPRIKIIFISFQKKRPKKLDRKIEFIRLRTTLSSKRYESRIIRSKAHIGIAPAINSAFYRSKAPAKFRDLARLGLPGIYSNCEPYNSVVVDGVNGILVNSNIESWTNAFKALIDEKVRENIVKASRETLIEYFSLDKFTVELESQIRGLGTKKKIQISTKLANAKVDSYAAIKLETILSEPESIKAWRDCLEIYLDIDSEKFIDYVTIIDCHRDEYENTDLVGEKVFSIFQHNETCGHLDTNDYSLKRIQAHSKTYKLNREINFLEKVVSRERKLLTLNHTKKSKILALWNNTPSILRNQILEAKWRIKN